MVAINEHNGANGNGSRSVWRNITAEAGAFTLVDVVAAAAGVTMVGIKDHLIPDAVQDVIAMPLASILEPNLERVEKWLTKCCKLEECQPDLTKSKKERALALAKAIIFLGVLPELISVGVELGGRRFADRLMGFNPHHDRGTKKGWRRFFPTMQEAMIIGSDKGAHLASLYAINGPMAPHTDDAIKVMSSILQSCGVSEKKAHEMATNIGMWHFSNIAGALAATGAIAGKHKFGWPYEHRPRTHLERLEQQTMLSSHVHMPQV